VVAEVEALLDFAEVGGGVGQPHLPPQPLRELPPPLRHLAPQHVHELGETDEVGALLVEHLEYLVRLGVSYVDALVLHHLLELLEVQQGVPVDVRVLHCLLKREEAPRPLGSQSLLYSHQN
jgi:hypothetical protein